MKPEEVVPGWERALAAKKPVVVDAHVDPEVPPLPPHIRFDQAKHLMFSILSGDPHRGRMIGQAVKQMFTPGKPKT
jgi:pyruvate dehydrogenase (quinone)